MSFQLTIDIGNTRTKLHLFMGDQVHRSLALDACDTKRISGFIGNDKVSAVIVASSIDIPGSLIYDLETFYKVLVLDADTELPVRNDYRSKDSLGYDRMAAAIGAWQLFPGSPVLAVVAGTCITYNIIVNNAFVGGAISPGLRMRSKAMHEFTAKLPEVQLKDVTSIVGKDTQDSLLSGVLNGASSEIKGMIAAYETEFPGLKTVVGGGDAVLLAKAMKNGIFARPDIVASGLHNILSFHVAQNLL